MSQVPHELIRQVQICTRAAAGLPDYDPSDPTLPALPPLSAAIAYSDPSAPHLHCKNCKGLLLRGTESIICLYCGLGPHYDTVPEPICFTSTIGYHWLLRSLRLNGSEMVDLSDKSEQDLGQSSPKSLTCLSEFLNFKMQWPVETEKQDTSSDKHSEESKRSLSLTGVAPGRFFLKSKRNGLSDMPIEQPSDHNEIGTTGRKYIASLDDQGSFQNVQSSEPAFSSSGHKTSEALWEADFESADSENQRADYKSSEHVSGSSGDSGIKFRDPESFQSSSVLEVDLSAHFDSVFGSGANLTDGKSKEVPAVSPAFDDWNSDDMWNNLSSGEPSFSGAFEANFSTKNNPQKHHTLEYLKDNSTTVDMVQDFQFQTNCTDMTKNETMNEEHRTMDEDLFEEWNEFTGSTSSQVPSQDVWPGVNDQVSTSDEKSSERDLFSFDNKFEGGDFGSFSQPKLFSTSTGNSNAPTEVNAIMSENPASNWFGDTSSPYIKSGQAANNGDAFEQSSKDDVKMLISQMHDLSFMLETDLSIPSGSDDPNSSAKD